MLVRPAQAGAITALTFQNRKQFANDNQSGKNTLHRAVFLQQHGSCFVSLSCLKTKLYSHDVLCANNTRNWSASYMWHGQCRTNINFRLYKPVLSRIRDGRTPCTSAMMAQNFEKYYRKICVYIICRSPDSEGEYCVRHHQFSKALLKPLACSWLLGRRWAGRIRSSCYSGLELCSNVPEKRNSWSERFPDQIRDQTCSPSSTNPKFAYLSYG